MNTKQSKQQLSYHTTEDRRRQQEKHRTMRFTAALASCVLMASGANSFSAAPSSFVSNAYRSTSIRTTKLHSASAAIPSDGSFADESAFNYGPGQCIDFFSPNCIHCK